MPSTLYESVKKSVIEFAELRKKNEKVEDKMVFRWKLITLGLSILFIVLVGAFSQILKGVNSLPDVTQDRSFVLPLLKDASDAAVPTLKQAGNLVAGISASISGSQEEYQYNRASLLYDFPAKDALDINSIVQKISNQGRLVILVSTTAVPAQRFAFFAYASYPDSSGNINATDQDSSKYSTFFNLQSSSILQYNLGCSIYRRTTTSLIFFESLSVNSDLSVSVGIQGSNNCLMGVDQATANAMITSLTGVDLTGLPSQTITVGSLQIFQIYLDESA